MSLTNVMQCKLTRERCRRTANYKHVGQNFYEVCSSAKSSPISRAFDLAIRSWVDEHNRISELSEEHFVDWSALKNTGRFLQLVKSNADRVGCSAIEYRDVRNYRCTIIECFYNARSIANVPTYEIGPAASRCETGANPKFNGLCSENEDYSKHEYADVFFTNKSPVVAEWLKNGKQICTGGMMVQFT